MFSTNKTDLKTKLIDDIYSCLSKETNTSKDEIEAHLDLNNLIRFLENKNKPKRKFNIKPTSPPKKNLVNKPKKKKNKYKTKIIIPKIHTNMRYKKNPILQIQFRIWMDRTSNQNF